jgi:transposase
MIEIDMDTESILLVGPQGSLSLPAADEITLRLGMLYEGECEGKGRSETARKFGYSRQRYHQLLQKFLSEGAASLKNQKRGPKSNYRRTDEVVRQIITYKFLDPDMSPAVIAQKLKQCGYQIAIRSVERVICEYGLQKKTSYPSGDKRGERD